MKESGFTIKKARSRQYPAEIIIDDLVLLTNTPAQVESLQHNLEQAAINMGLSMNSDTCVLIKLMPSPH